MDIYQWPLRADFLNRKQDLEELEQWWQAPPERHLNLYGRRRAGKSWLFRAFAHGKPAMIFTASERGTADQLARFAEQLEPTLGVRPAFGGDFASFFRTLFRLARTERLLVVIDEFPWLVASNPKLPSLLFSVIEEEEDSQLRLILCGSHVSQMEEIFAERSPLGGRFRKLRIRPLTFFQALDFLPELSAEDAVTRYAVAGGMPYYLRSLGTATQLRDLLSSLILSPRGSLYDEPRSVLSQELRKPNNYFSILSALASGFDLTHAELRSHTRLGPSTLSKYLHVLEGLDMVEPYSPVTEARQAARSRRYRIRDPFLRFWFRFVFDVQQDLDAGLDPAQYFDAHVRPHLPELVAPVFEGICRSWAREEFKDRVTRVGGWWGRALDALRRTHQRNTEEIDLVALDRRSVTVLGECRWRSERMGLDVLQD
ncbi:MAG: ATP-binding protein, partial [Candidatus Dormibacteraceae bacterium]